MSDFEIPPAVVASLDQMDASIAAHKSELLRTAIEGPGEDVHWEQPVRLWQEHGIDCAILRNRMGALCGYALVPHGHPWWGLDDDSEVPNPKTIDKEMTAEQAMDDFGVMPVFLAGMREGGVEAFERRLGAQVQVHGGLTWTGPIPIKDAPWGWWLGFDCLHHMDAVDPAHVTHESRAELNQRMIDEFGAHVWTEDEVAGEVGRLALAIHEAR